MEYERSLTESPETAFVSDSAAEARPFIPQKEIRKARRKEKRRLNQIERSHIRESLHAGLRDPDVFLELDSRKKITRKQVAAGKAERLILLATQKRKVRAELNNTRDLDTFIQKTCHSKTLLATIAMGFFRHVLHSEAYREDHRYKLAILRALEEPGLSRSIQHKWDAFDREFPDPASAQSW
jgi:hypothetical protein